MTKSNMLPALCCAKCCYKLNLQQFGEGAASAGAAPGTTAAGTGETTGGAAAGKTADSAQNGRDAAVRNTAEANTLPQTANSSEPDKEAEFEKLIRGEYKAQFAARTQKILAQRFRQLKTQSTTGEETGPRQAQNADVAEQREAVAKAICRSWACQEKQTKAVYPKFTMEAEMKRPDFTRFLKAGVSIKQAYEACHLPELLGGAMQYAADRAAAAAAARVTARAARPAENGTTSRAGAVMHTDVSQLSRTQREQIEQRAAHGEHIRF